MKNSEDRQFVAPQHLSDRAEQLWNAIVPRRARSTERLTLLQTALECLDRADEAKQILDAEGLTIKTLATGTIHVHPMLKVEQESRRQFVKIWDSMGLDFAHLIDGNLAQIELDQPSVGLPAFEEH